MLALGCEGLMGINAALDCRMASISSTVYNIALHIRSDISGTLSRSIQAGLSSTHLVDLALDACIQLQMSLLSSL